jgi:hypothetical protein
MMKHDQVKLLAASRNRSGNLSDSSEQSELLQQSRRDSTTDVSHYDGLTGLDSKHLSRINAHIGATYDYCFQSLQRLWKRWHWGSGLFVAFQHEIEVIHEDSPEEKWNSVLQNKLGMELRLKLHDRPTSYSLAEPLIENLWRVEKDRIDDGDGVCNTLTRNSATVSH